MPLNLPFLTKDVLDTGTKKPIQEFVSMVKTAGMARSNRYAVLFTPPAGVDPTALRKVLLFCDQVQIPGANYSTVQNRTFGEFRETPYEKIYDNITMSFYVDADMEVKKLFDRWMDTISDPTTRTYNYYDNYTSNMTIEVQDINDKSRYQVNLFECYPKSISSIQMDYNAKDVMKLTVSMQYKYWKVDQTTQLADDQVISTSLMDKFNKNFTGFQKAISDTFGDAGTFATGAVINYGITKLPGLLRF